MEKNNILPFFFKIKQFVYYYLIKMENIIKIILLFFIIGIFFQYTRKSFKMNFLNNFPYFIKIHYINNLLVKDNDDLLLNIEKTKIENILILIEIIPFLKNNLFINLQNDKALFLFFKKVFERENIDDYNIKINRNDNISLYYK